MDCPYCKTTMIKGTIKSRGLVRFHEERQKEKGKLLSWFLRKSLCIDYEPSYYCPTCKMIIIREVGPYE